MAETLDFHTGRALGHRSRRAMCCKLRRATGTKTATASARAHMGPHHILALRPRGRRVEHAHDHEAAGVAQEDVLIASIAVGPNTVTITPPAGWALVRRMDNATGTTTRLRSTTSSPGSRAASYDWTFSAGNTGAPGHPGVLGAITIEVENGRHRLGHSSATRA